jgi:hypothetical protein
LVVIGALAVAVSVVGASPAFAAKGGNHDTPKLCQKGGWKALVSQTRDPFANQGDCVNDGAQGLGVAPHAGQTACANIGGTFSLGGNDPEILWTCKYSVPPNPVMPQELVNACETDTSGNGALSSNPLVGQPNTLGIFED